MRGGLGRSVVCLSVWLFALQACVSSAPRRPSSDATSFTSAAALPAVEGVLLFWPQLHALSREPALDSARCLEALHLGEAWWQSLREEAQTLFHDVPAPDEETVRDWTVERRLFFERWLGSPEPVLKLEDGSLRLSRHSAEVFARWATCVGDPETLQRWRLRSVGP